MINMNSHKNDFKTKLDLEVFKTVLNFSYSGIVVINKDKIIVNINKWAEEFLNMPIPEMLYKETTDFFPDSDLVKVLQTGEVHKNRLAIRNNKKIIINRIPIYSDNEIIGAVALFQDVNKIQENEMDIRNKIIDTGFFTKYNFDDIIHKSQNMVDVIKIAKIYAKTSSAILINGESGTGKELFAQSIHNYSDRKDCPFVALNCTTLPESILESELFGYSEASFTGAKKGGKMGLFQQAHKGTIFLDEIGEIPLSVQAKLLRVLQEKQVRPIGSNKIIPVDVRIISATNKNLIEEVEKGNFRLDLMYRLNVLNLKIPPLRERKEDIILFSINYFTKVNHALYSKNKKIIMNILNLLSNHDFPGNIRELENVLSRLTLLLEANLLKDDLNMVINQLIDKYSSSSIQNINHNVSLTLENTEKQEIIDLLIQMKGSKNDVAKHMGISRSTLWEKIKKYNIN